MFRRGEEKDYYAVLQVDPRADTEVIEAAYRRLSRKYHPDVSGDPGAGRRMRDLNEAYEVLGDPKRRAAYDRRRALGIGPGPAPRPLRGHDVVRLFLPYLLLAVVVLLAARLLPLLLRPPIVLALLVAVLGYVLARRLRRR